MYDTMTEKCIAVMMKLIQLTSNLIPAFVYTLNIHVIHCVNTIQEFLQYCTFVACIWLSNKLQYIFPSDQLSCPVYPLFNCKFAATQSTQPHHIINLSSKFFIQQFNIIMPFSENSSLQYNKSKYPQVYAFPHPNSGCIYVYKSSTNVHMCI